MWPLLSWLLEYWFVIPWLIGVVVAYIYGGRNLALVVATLGIGAFAYNAGRKSERETHNARAEKIESERENAYTEIDARGTDRDDVTERLRNNNF